MPDVFSFPASFAQQRLWFLDQLVPGSCAYNLPAAFHLTGELNLKALGRSLNEIVRRHETLRTTFTSRDGLPYQVITPAGAPRWPDPPGLPITDLQDEPESGRMERALALVLAEALQPFNLQQGPLFYAHLFRLGAAEHILLLNMHHIISDGWSAGVLRRELTSLYAAFAGGEPSPLPDLPIQYVDFTAWQQEQLQGAALENHLDYWRRQLSGAGDQQVQDWSPVLNLPTDRPRPAVQTFNGDHFSMYLSQSLTAALKEMSRSSGATLYMTLLAAFSILLGRYSRQEDLLIGSPIANRSQVELEGLIGFFANTLVMRCDLGGNPTFTDLLGRVRKTCLDAYTHQDLPFEKLVEEIHPQRDLSRTPFVQAVLALQNVPREHLSFPGVALELLPLKTAIVRFDLECLITENATGLHATWRYNTDLFDRATINRMAGNFQTLLEGISADPGTPISNLPILSLPEQRQILNEWSANTSPYPTTCLHTLFEEQVRRTPDSPAVYFENERLTFSQLNRRANQVAHTLLSQGAGPDVLVGVCLPRSLDMVAALLGVLKAGAAYVPLDPAYPKERLAFMLADSQAPLLVTHQCLLAQFPDLSTPRFAGVRSICLDAQRDAIARQSQENPASPVKPENLAYVLYTSGSTGLPKGVAIEHRSSAAAFLQWAQTVITPEERRGVLASTSFNFDLSLFELFLPLCFGGCAVLVQNLLALPETPSAPPITLINTVPSLMGALLKSFALPLSAGTVCLAGEPLPQALVQQLYTQPGVQRLLNLYGPTETTTYSTWAPIEKDAPPPPPIGRPIANTRVYLLDAALQPAPVGVPAELFIAGAGLARGYLNRPELTAEKFVTLHLPGLPPQRAYRSGDLVRWSPEGCLEYLGRLDSQVKIRGFRIELGEIENVLARHPAVKEAVVLGREDEPGEKRLAAYVIPAPGADPTPGELRAFLKERLPDFMLPAAFVFLESFPLTPSGKVNRRALPAPGPLHLHPLEQPALPRTPVEEKLAEIWKRVLGLEQVGVGDNFFDLGGHSLKATQVISRVRKTFNIELPLRRLFEFPTIAGLARCIEDALLKISEGENGDGAADNRRPSGTIQPAPRRARRPGGGPASSRDHE